MYYRIPDIHHFNSMNPGILDAIARLDPQAIDAVVIENDEQLFFLLREVDASIIKQLNDTHQRLETVDPDDVIHIMAALSLKTNNYLAVRAILVSKRPKTHLGYLPTGEDDFDEDDIIGVF